MESRQVLPARTGGSPLFTTRAMWKAWRAPCSASQSPNTACQHVLLHGRDALNSSLVSVVGSRPCYNSVRPTLAGRDFVKGIRWIPDELQVVIDGAEPAGRGEAGYLTIGFYISFSAGNLRKLSRIRPSTPRLSRLLAGRQRQSCASEFCSPFGGARPAGCERKRGTWRIFDAARSMTR